ncbi:MAG: histidinol-phosphate aminotransferase [Sphingobacteriales bacterium]|jgi:histidinol-phosphate aminotransferase
MKSQFFRPHIHQLKAYSSARNEFGGEASVFLDANENNLSDFPFFRYPGEEKQVLKSKIAEWNGLKSNQIFLGNGSDEIIDLIIRACCEPGKDAIVLNPPSYGMYDVCAALNNVAVKSVPMRGDYWDMEALLAIANPRKKLMFICSPNNPTGTSIQQKDLELLLSNFSGTVVVDEAYIEFSEQKSAVALIEKYSNLLVLRTFSKAYGMAGARVGWCVASESWIGVLNTIAAPYNVNSLSIQALLDLDFKSIQPKVEIIKKERKVLLAFLEEREEVSQVWGTDANYILFASKQAAGLFLYLRQQGIVIRDRSAQIKDALRVSIGTPAENEQFKIALNTFFNAA